MRISNRFIIALLFPATALYLFVFIIPAIQALLYSLYDWSGFGSDMRFIGLGNFVRMARDNVFLGAVTHNFIFMVIQVPIMIFLALLLAVLLNQGIRSFRGALRLAIFVVIDNEALLPDEYKEMELTLTVRKQLVQKALGEGRTVPGAHLEASTRLDIR